MRRVMETWSLPLHEQNWACKWGARPVRCRSGFPCLGCEMDLLQTEPGHAILFLMLLVWEQGKPVCYSQCCSAGACLCAVKKGKLLVPDTFSWPIICKIRVGMNRAGCLLGCGGGIWPSLGCEADAQASWTRISCQVLISGVG